MFFKTGFFSAALAFMSVSITHADPLMSEGQKVLACIEASAEIHHLPAGLLLTLLRVEAGELGKVSQNKNKTVDIGPMQINDSWVHKIARHWGASDAETYRALRDNFCANVAGGGWILRQTLDEAKGDIWEGVALYHSHTPVHKVRYLHQVLHHLHALQKEAQLSSRNSGS
ncbi:lytic transglycosylase domain-containing protein [Beijerinckia mobilis]|uniref:lytic transglycosylase domain-containing protein n=1 Tax=Beijerinckia mobilis TaxID=231434 RepID=UPI00054D6D98|nr:lytic transglycosylase domain-containing protein [Beijerinckia mobilis]